MIRKYNSIEISNTNILLLAALILSFIVGGCSSNPGGVKGKEYKRVSGIYGTVKVSGSTAMSNLMSLWCQGFSDIYHKTSCIVESFGSSKAPSNLIEGKMDIGMMSAQMTDADINNFKKTYGYDPVEFKVAVDMIVILVNTENPLECVTIDQLDGIYSNSYLCPGAKDITTWGGLNLVADWSNSPINPYGRTPLSGTYGVFKEMALCKGNYKNSIKELASSRDIVDFVTQDVYSIGYIGSGYITPEVKALKVGKTQDNCYAPTSKNATSKQYPFTRNLYLYPRQDPSKNMKNLTREFLKYIFSKEGQEAVYEAGLVNLPPDVIIGESNKLSN